MGVGEGRLSKQWNSLNHDYISRAFQFTDCLKLLFIACAGDIFRETPVYKDCSRTRNYLQAGGLSVQVTFIAETLFRGTKIVVSMNGWSFCTDGR